MLQWHGDQAFDAIARAAATGLLRAATFFETQHSLRISKPNPPPYHDSSAPGEYPRLRTGAGRSGLTHEPTSVDEVMRSGSVRVGFRTNVAYMLILELSPRLRRLGLERTLQDLRGALGELVLAEFRKS